MNRGRYSLVRYIRKNLQTVLTEMYNIFLTFKLNINTTKTNVLVCSEQTEPNINISLKGNRIEQVE